MTDKPMNDEYYVPHQSQLPIFTALGLGLCALGGGVLLNAASKGESGWQSSIILYAGSLILAFVMFKWFQIVIGEHIRGLNSQQLQRSYVWGMIWFIFSEVMFFVAFFGALFYVRYYVGPWLGGEGDKGVTNMLYPGFAFEWPPVQNPDEASFASPKAYINAFTIPLLNTVLLLLSSVTLSASHEALRNNNRSHCQFLLGLTVFLGVIFIFFQAYEYYEAYAHLGLTLGSGIYGSTFFILTGFHGAHVTLGCIMLFVILMRMLKGHFTADDHFGFTAAAWYWHFVDVVWMLLFVFVYII